MFIRNGLERLNTVDRIRVVARGVPFAGVRAPTVNELLFVALSVEPGGGKRRSREEFQPLMTTTSDLSLNGSLP
jgi:hypothetical protein